MPTPPTRADLFWRQSQELFDRWEFLLERDPARVRRECALYRRWLANFRATDRDAALVQEILLEMLADLMVDATLRK